MKVDQEIAMPSTAGADEPSAKIDRLLADGKAKQAVELAKEQHKKFNTAQSEQTLVRAYLARIAQFHSKGMAEEAQSLMALVSERFPTQRHQLGQMRWRGAVAAGQIAPMLSDLQKPGTPTDERQNIEDTIRRELIDPSAIVSAGVLPAEHPLRTSAEAIGKALEAVTAGPVNDEQIALPMVSHRSPLAAWKLLIRAIAAFYRREDDACRRALDGIPADSAVAPLAVALRGAVDGTLAKGGAAKALQLRVVADMRPLTAALESIDQSYRYRDEVRLERAIRSAVRECTALRPEFLDRLKQFISVTCYFHGAPSEAVLGAMGPSRKDAFFWRQFALAAEKVGEFAESAAYWERFLRHSVREGAFPEAGPEGATVWMHLADLLAQQSSDDIEIFCDHVVDHRLISNYYCDQPPEIAALKPASDKEYADRVCDPGYAFAQATRLYPLKQTFQQWLAWAKKSDEPRKTLEDIASAWNRGLPGDVEPLLLLADFAEKREALSMALKRIAEAEAVDPANAKVRQARIRLMLAIAWRHLGQEKLKLLEADLREMALLPGLRDTESGALLSFLTGILRFKEGDRPGASEQIEAGMRRLGALAGGALLRSVLLKGYVEKFDSALVPPNPADPLPMDAVRADAILAKLSLDLDMPIHRPMNWDAPISTVLRDRNSPVAISELRWIGRGAVSSGNFQLGYLAASAGLARSRTPAESARFLLIRAQSMTARWADRRVRQCLSAALDLAKSAHDEKLLEQVLREVDESVANSSLFGYGRDRFTHAAVNSEEILRLERSAPEPPTNGAEADAHLVPSVANDDNDDFDPESDHASNPSFFDWGDDDEDDDDESVEGDDNFPTDILSSPDGLRDFLTARGVSVEAALANPRLVLELLANPNQGISPETLRAMQAELQALPPQAGHGRRPNRRKRRRR